MRRTQYLTSDVIDYVQFNFTEGYFQEICVDVMGVSMDTIHEYLKLGRNLPSKVLVDRCAKVGFDFIILL